MERLKRDIWKMLEVYFAGLVMSVGAVRLRADECLRSWIFMSCEQYNAIDDAYWRARVR